MPGPKVVIVGAGPAGLMAAEVLARGGARVVVHERMPSPARRLLMAGRGGLNLTHSEALADMLSGQTLCVISTDGGSVRDFQAFAKQTGNALLAHTVENGEFTFLMRRK